jgi:hypothetical protein
MYCIIYLDELHISICTFMIVFVSDTFLIVSLSDK